MGSRYSALAIARLALSGAAWPRAWRAAKPLPSYDAVIIGGGGHGLATAYYLAANHGMTRVAVIERGYIGSGNVGRNTTLVRSNYQMPGNTQFFEHSLKLWEGLSHTLNYNVMLSQRGQIVLAHGPSQLDVLERDIISEQHVAKLLEIGSPAVKKNFISKMPCGVSMYLPETARLTVVS